MEIGSSTFGLCPNNKSIDKTIEEIVEASSNFVTRNSHGVDRNAPTSQSIYENDSSIKQEIIISAFYNEAL